jgi:uncharacterized protein YndB with AHSA1/START domain
MIGRMVDTKNRELITTRIISASPERVWQAFTDPKEVGLWWGPAGFTNTIDTMDLRPGGEWRYVMHGPDGTDYPNALTYDEIEKPNRIVYSHHASKEFGLEAWTMIQTFEAAGDQTRVTMHAIYASLEDYTKHMVDFHAKEGAEQMLERLEAFVKPSG